jgi:hypothetical protein
MKTAHYAATWGPRVKLYYQHKANHTHKMVAKKAVANKLAKACYHMLVLDEPFDVNRAFAWNVMSCRGRKGDGENPDTLNTRHDTRL